jgi:hypothetical protein
MIAQTLQTEVVDTLRQKLDYPCDIWTHLGQVILEINNIEFEMHMGCLLQQLQRIIDHDYPDRDENLFLIIKNKERGIENIIKIWKPS